MLSVRQFEGFFAVAVGNGMVVPALDQIAASAEAWAQRAEVRGDAAAVGQARRVLLDCVEVSSTGYRTSRLSWVGADRDRDAVTVVAELVDVGILTTVDSADGTDAPDAAAAAVGGVVLVDVQVVNVWPRLARWVRGAWADLETRTGLEHDARRWHAAGQPQELLHDYRRIELAAVALHVLNQPDSAPAGGDASPGGDVSSAAGGGFRFGVATVGDIPVTVWLFWAASQTWAVYRLRVDQVIMALLITLAVMVVGLGFTLAAVT